MALHSSFNTGTKTACGISIAPLKGSSSGPAPKFNDTKDDAV